MSRSTSQVLMLIVSYVALAVAWGWRLHANDPVPDKKAQMVEEVRLKMAAWVAKAPATGTHRRAVSTGAAAGA